MARSLAAFVLMVVGATLGVAMANAACPADADTAHWIDGGGACLTMSVAGDKTAGPSPRLVVLIHGDVSEGGPATYLYPLAQSVAKPGVVVVALLRPGYSDADGRASQGSHNNRRDNYTTQNITIVGKAIAALKARYRARRVVVMGHSGGAAITGVLIGRQPGLIDAAVLVSCPCDVPAWRAERKAGLWPNSLSPHMFTTTVPKSTVVVTVTGADDDNTRPALVEAYVRALAERGIKARADVVAGAAHGSKPLLRAVEAAIQRLL